MARVLVATPEPIGRRLAGPAIRAAQIARVLSFEHDVRLVSLGGPGESPVDGTAVHGPDAITDDFDAAIVQGSVTIEHPELLASDMALVVDWFDPFHVEALHRGGADRVLRHDLAEGARKTLFQQAERGDFFLCSNQVQREHWLGWLAAAGRLNPATHDHDQLFESLIAVAPFGVSVDSVAASTPIRDMFSVVGEHDPVLLWAGGLHDWLDPLTFVRAMPTVLDENPDAKLVFLAGPHPNTAIEHMGLRGEAIALSREMKLFGTSVLFVNRWVDYTERLEFHRDATVGVVADRSHLEGRYAHRTRLLDHLAVGLPTVSTAGDPLSAELEAAGAAITVERDHEVLGKTLGALVNDDARLEQLSRAAFECSKSLSWEVTLVPLLRWLEHPRRAADLRGRRRLVSNDPPTAIEHASQRVRLHLHEGGPAQVVQRGVGALRRRFGR